MKVVVYAMDEFGCGKYRSIWPAEALQAQGYDIQVIVPADDRGIKVYIDGDHVFHVTVPEDADLLVFQRVTHHHLAHAIGWLVNHGMPCIVDVDDDLSAIHPQNQAWAALHPNNAAYPLHSWHNLNIACNNATLVTVSAEALLKRYAVHGRGAVLHNRIPERYLEIGRQHRDSDVIAWPGSLHSHPDDPAEARIATGRLVREGATFRIVGEPMWTGRAFGLEKDPDGTGGVPFDDYPQAVSQIGIGIAPLADSRFNQAKSWLKPLEMSALGVPWVASGRVEYRRLASKGCGLIANKPKDWYRHLHRLWQDPEMRREKTQQGLAVAAQLTIEQGAEEWARAWGLARKPTAVNT